ncbi:hypothetical protein ACQRIT_007227 [Beauveria bassiana]
MRLRQRLLLSTIDSALKHRRRRFVRRVYICLRLLRKRTFGKCPSGTPQIKVRPMEPIWTQDAIHELTGNLGGLIHDSADAVASRRRDRSLTNAMHDKSRPSHA